MHSKPDRCGVFIGAGEKLLLLQCVAEHLLELVSLVRVVCSHMLALMMVWDWFLRISPFSKN